ncbi:T9SS type A sorting domain-containing protein [uncultured Draconibacterium sp.]|uniref:T9SS type A sorting domain-containing protein n=1 Tax=uncultured Draconibacterium sp. TaxID=1573823 RepID=UPI003217F72F
MNRSLLLVSIFIFFSFSLLAQTTILTEGFETDGEGTRYTSSTFFNCTNNDYFVRTNSNPYICSTAGFGNALLSVQGSYFWVSEDIESVDNPNATFSTLTLNSIDISSYSNVTVSLFMAVGQDATILRWEPNDKVEIQASIDGGTNYFTIGRFVGDDTFGGNLRRDTNLDGTADTGEPILTTTFTNYTFNAPAGGTSLLVRIYLDGHDGSEEFAFDQIVVQGDAGPPANFAPVLAAIESSTIVFSEGDAAVAVSSSITVSDADDTDLDSASVEICTGFTLGEDVLSFTPANGIVGSYNSSTGILKLTGTSSLSNYQAALRAVQYQNTNTTNPSNVTREICFKVNDGTDDSNVQSRNIAIMDVISEVVCLPFDESFESDGEGIRYVSNTFTDFPNSDYFYRTNTQPAGHADAVTGIDGSYFWASEDVISAASSGLEGVIEFAPLNIVGNSSFTFEILMGTSNNDGTRWEQTDNILLQYNIDDNGWNTFGLFQGDDPFGGDLRVDLDNSTDTVGGGGPYGATVPNGSVDDFSFNFSGSGTEMKIRIVVQQDGGTEELVFDNIRINGDVSAALSCNDINVYLDGSGSASIVESDLTSLTSAACGVDSVKIDTYNFTCADKGANSVVVTAYYDNLSTETCTSTVTVLDTVSPTADCNNISVYLDGAGNATIVASDLDGGSGDNCGSVSLSASLTSFTCADIGANSVTLTVTDGSSNASICQATVTVIDTVSPSVTCKDTTVYLDGNGNATIDSSFVVNTSADNCGIASLSVDITSFDCSDIGANAVVLTAADGSSNQATCNATVTILDTISPTAICKDTTIYLDGSNSVSIDSSFIDNGSSDNCSILTMTLDVSDFDCSNIGANSVVLTITDANSNVSSCSSTVTLLDTIAPIASCKDTTVYLDATGFATIDSSFVNNGSGDGCETATIELSQTSFDCDDAVPPLGAGTYVAGLYGVNNTGELFIIDVSTGNGTLLGNLGQGFTELEYNDSTMRTYGQFPNGAFGGSEIDLGFTTLKGSPIGNGGSFTGLEWIGDTLYGAYIESPNGASMFAKLDPWTGAVTNIGLTGVGPLSGLAYDESTDVLYGCQGGGGTFLVSIDRNTGVAAPVGDMGVNLGSLEYHNGIMYGGGGQSPFTGKLYSINKTSGLATEIGDTGFNGGALGGLASVRKVPVTAVEVTVTVSDIYGNSSTCTSLVTVLDTISPVAQCKDTVVYLDAGGNISINGSYVDSSSTDACGISNLTLDVSDFDCSNIGANTVTLTVNDNHGNSSSCISEVTVLDTIVPVVSCQDTIIYLDSNGVASIDTGFVYSNANDACGIADVWLSKTDFSGDNLGANFVNVLVSDINGNVGSCISTVTVMDTIAPEARCKNIGITLDLEGKARIYPGFIDDGSTDEGGIVSYTLDMTKFYCHDIGEHTVVMSVTDVGGNVSTCSSLVTIADNWLPEVACNDIEVTLGSEGFVVIDSSMIDAGSTAICGISGIELSQSVFTSADLGENSITMTVSNLSGITATCEAKVTVKDEIAPVANCNSITVWLTDSASYELTEADLVAISSGSSDNASASDSLQVEVSPSVFYCSQVGDSVKVDVSVFDEAGNESTCEAMVYVKDSSDVLLSSVENIEISLPAGECETTITYPEVFSSKACATITQIAGLGAEGLFPAGTTVESWEVSYGEEKDTVSFAVIVSAENAVPTIDSLADVSVNEDEGPVVIALSGISAGVDCVEQTLSITAENSNSELVSGIEVVYTDGDTTGSISLTLGANQSGTDSLTIVVEDSEGAQTTVSFALTVNPVNDAPYLVTPLPDAIVNASYSFELELSAMMGVVFDDVDDDVLAFDVMLEGTDSLPSWAAIEAGVLTATPMIADTGSYSFVVTATDTSGAMASDTFVLEVDGYPTAIGDIGAGSFELNLYPNPTKGLVTVELQERSATDIEIKVMNVSGAEVFRKNFGANDKIQINLSDQVSGMYMVLIEADGQRVVKKLILDKR